LTSELSRSSLCPLLPLLLFSPSLKIVLRQHTPFIHVSKRLDGKLVPAPLLGEPLSDSLPHDPAFAPVDAFGHLIQARNKIVGQLGSDHSSVIAHSSLRLTKKAKSIISNMEAIRLPSKPAFAPACEALQFSAAIPNE
jgi:hypothetical protein